MNRSLLFVAHGLLCASLLSACSGENKTAQKNDSTVNQTSVTAPPVEEKKPLEENFYKRFEGEVGGKPVVMYLEKAGTYYAGSYSYGNAPIRLMVDTLIGKNKIVFFESNTAGPEDQENKLSITWNGNGFTGELENAQTKKKYPVQLHERNIEGSYPLSTARYADSVKIFPKKEESPVGRAEYKYLYTTATDENSKWLNNSLKKIFPVKTALSWDAAIKDLTKTYLSDYKKSILEELKEQGNDSTSYTMNYEQNTTQSVKYNGNGYVVVDLFDYEYTGGAHGNYGDVLYCFDVQNKKQLTLKDIVKVDDRTLQKLLESNFKKQYKVKQGEQLNTYLFENYLKPGDKFYFTENGLVFLYNPYEVASYAQGTIEVFISFGQLKPYINPVFAKRMGLI